MVRLIVNTMLYLHSTMYLLNPIAPIVTLQKSAFTFHYVSIKSLPLVCHPSTLTDLHSTMYLLNHAYILHDKDINTEFTFHYVSIKSDSADWFDCMKTFIYIPLCIY